MEIDSGKRQLTISLRPLPQETQLLQNYPNPFNPETWIPFELSQDGEVNIAIYDVQGKRIRQLKLGMVMAGRHLNSGQAAYWDGKTEEGEAVPVAVTSINCGPVIT